MADIQIPENLANRITAVSLLPWEPGLQSHRSEYTGQQSFAYYAPGAWRGEVTWMSFAHQQEDEANRLASQLSALLRKTRGGDLTVALPLAGLWTIENPVPSVTISAIDAQSGRLTLSRAVALADGQFFSAGDRLLQAYGAQPAATQVNPVPVFVGTVGDGITPATTMDVRLDTRALDLPRTATRWGPWVIPFEEAV